MSDRIFCRSDVIQRLSGSKKSKKKSGQKAGSDDLCQFYAFLCVSNFLAICTLNMPEGT
jgi:hypothetical protein